MSVLDYLRPQRVGTRKKTINALPIGGNFVIDVDSCQRARGHDHKLDPIWGVCPGCLEKSRVMTFELADRILEDHEIARWRHAPRHSASSSLLIS
jgi:hypothetical protein